MANIDTIKDASGKTIADYSEEYFKAKERGDAAAMAAANAAANAIRSNNGAKTDWATTDIANVAAKNQSGSSGSSNGGYTTINQNLHDGTDTDKSKFYGTLLDTIGYANANPGVTQAFTQQEFDERYGNVQSPTAQGYTIGQMYDIGAAGQYTYDEAEADYAASQGYTVAQTTYNGKPAYIITPNENTSRTRQSGTSGADEDLLNSQQYAAVQYEKQQWSNYDALYKQALASGNTALAEQYLAQRDQAHTNAERIRAGAWLGSYSGGQDGSTYLTYGELAEPDTYNFTNTPLYEGDNVYADALVQRYPNLYGNPNDASQSILGGLPSGGGSGGSLTLGVASGGSSDGVTNSPLTSGTGATPQTSLTVPEAGELTPLVDDYSTYLEQMYAAQKEAALAQLKAVYDQNVNAIDRAGKGLNSAYQNARNQIAGSGEQARRNFAEYAAANGLNSGTGGQAELSRNVTLQNNLNSINTAEADALADLELQRANAETDYNNAIAQAEAEGDYELAAALYQEKVRVQNALIDAQIQEYQQALTNYQLQYQAQRDAVSDSQWQQAFDFQKQQWADQLAQQQYENTFQQQQYADSLAQLYASNVGDGSGSNSGASSNGNYNSGYDSSYDSNAMLGNLLGGYNVGSSVPTTTTTTPTSNKVSYNNGSLNKSEVKAMQNYYGLDADGYWGPNSQATTGLSADQAWAQYIGSNSRLGWAQKVLNNNGGNADALYAAMVNRGDMSVEEIDSVLAGLGL